MSAASVIAAGSVMKEPRSGTKARTVKYIACDPGMGSARAVARTPALASSRIGRLPAITMMAKTKSGSVKSRESR